MKDAKDGSKSLKAGAEQVDDNLAVLKEGLNQISIGTSDMPQKTQQLQNGTNAVYKGSGELVMSLIHI